MNIKTNDGNVVTQTGDIVLVINVTENQEFTPLLQEHGYV